MYMMIVYCDGQSIQAATKTLNASLCGSQKVRSFLMTYLIIELFVFYMCLEYNQWWKIKAKHSE